MLRYGQGRRLKVSEVKDERRRNELETEGKN
jgi:hypothetical protein